MSRTLLFPLLLLLWAQTASAQCTKKLSELPAAPELVGFRLGMTKDEIKTHVPQTAFGKADHFGVTKTTINPYFDPKIDKTKFAGVRSISLDLVEANREDIQSRLKARETPQARFCWQCRKPLHARTDQCPFCGERQ